MPLSSLLVEEKEALEQELRKVAEKLKLSQAAAAAVSSAGGRGGGREQEGEGGAAAWRLRVREVENIREALELEVEEKDAFIARLQKQNEDSQQRVGGGAMGLVYITRRSHKRTFV